VPDHPAPGRLTADAAAVIPPVMISGSPPIWARTATVRPPAGDACDPKAFAPEPSAVVSMRLYLSDPFRGIEEAVVPVARYVSNQYALYGPLPAGPNRLPGCTCCNDRDQGRAT
jgi:hypothetical protein